MSIKFNVINQTLSGPFGPLIVSRSQDYLKARFKFSNDWQGTQHIAQFVKGNLKYNITLDDTDTCMVPWELLQTEGTFTVTVWGNNLQGQDNLVITTNAVSIKVRPDGLNDELLPMDPTAGLEGGLLTQCQEYAESAQQHAGMAASSEENAAASAAAAAASAAVLANSPHFEFDSGELYLVYNS